MIDRPYFMENEEWYEYDFDKRMFVLTDAAPQEAIQSYQEYEEAMRVMESKN